MLRVSDLSKKFGSLCVFDRFSFCVPEGGFTILIGPSGCGKSTLFDVLTGVVSKDSGEISWLGEKTLNLGRKAAYMQQKDLLLPWLSLIENALLPVRVSGKTSEEVCEEAASLFRRLGLAGFESYPPSKVSGGMRQRCALVRTLMFGRELVLLDEPLSALDAITRRSLQSLLLLLQSEFGKSLLMITHDVEEALQLADELLVLTPPPMRIREKFSLTGEKPRRMNDPGLIEIKEYIFTLLHGENGDVLG
ncbi:MAG: ABC transporter ATP-binding protein [Desulfatiglandaceae bacterium]